MKEGDFLDKVKTSKLTKEVGIGAGSDSDRAGGVVPAISEDSDENCGGDAE